MSYGSIQPRLFRLSLMQTGLLVVITGCALAAAFALRYGLVEPRDLTIQCDAGGQTFACLVRRVTVGIFLWYGFGLVALGAAVLGLIRPSFLLLAVAGLAGAFGLVLYNTTMAAAALSLLPLMFARPRPTPDFAPE